MSLKKIKQIIEKETDKKIGRESLKRIEIYLEGKIRKIAKHAERQADFNGRKIIKVEDLGV